MLLGQVFTTAEIVIGYVNGLRFARPFDDRTGYGELSVEPCPSTLADRAKTLAPWLAALGVLVYWKWQR